MASIPLPALSIRPPEQQQSPIQSIGQILALKNAMQQGQLHEQQIAAGQQENQLRALQLQDQTMLRSSAQGLDWSKPDTFDKWIENAQQKGVSPQTLSQLSLQRAQYKEQLAKTDEQTLKTQGEAANQLLGHIDAIKGISDPAKRAQIAQSQATQILNAGLVKDPNMAQMIQAIAQGQKVPTDEELQSFETGLIDHKSQVDQALKQQQTRKETATAALEEIKAKLATGAKPGDFDKQIDAIAPPTGPNAPLNQRTKVMVNSALQRGDVEGATKAIEAASSQLGAIEKETNPQVMAARVSQAVATEKATQAALAPQLSQIANTTRAGRTYINREDIPEKSKGLIEQQAAQAGIPVVDKDVAGTLSEIDTAKANQQSMMDLVGKKLAASPGERIYKGPENKLASAMQTDPDLGAMGTFRNAAIQTMRAVAGSKGLRINKYEVQLAIDNDIPKMTDTWAVAQSKIASLQKFLDNTENAHLTRNRATGTATNIDPVADLLKKYPPKK